jgi:hypothetical protein
MVPERDSCHDASVSASITILATEVEDRRQFEALELADRRRLGVSSHSYPSRSGRYPHRVLVQATGIDLGVYEFPPDEDDYENGGTMQTFIIDGTTIEAVIPRLEAVVETNAEATARALVAMFGETTDLARVSAAMESGDWPEAKDGATEAAAFAKHFLMLARYGALSGHGICFEYRGEFPLEGKGP